MKTIFSLIFFTIQLAQLTIVLADLYTFADFYVANTLEIVNYQSSFLNSSRSQNSIKVPIPSQFNNPQVIFCIHQADIDTRPNWVAFQVSSQIDLANKQVQFTAQQFQDSAINNLRLTYLIVEHQSVFITQESYLIPTSNNQLQISISKSYKKSSSSPPQVYIYLTGYQSQLQGSINKLQITVTQQASGFNIIITRSDTNISQVYYNYIEVYNDSSIQFSPFSSGANIAPYYGLNGGQDSTFQDSTQTDLNTDVSTKPYGEDRYSNYVNKQTGISVASGQSVDYTQAGIIIGFVGFEFDISNRNQGIRMIIQDFTLSSNSLSFRYRTWNIARLRGIVSQYFSIAMIQCNQYSSTPINNSLNFKCVSSCNPTGYFPYLYNSQCTANQPPNTYCDNVTRICQACPSQCNGCTIDMKCIQCKSQTDYFLNGQCTSTIPPNSYCNQYKCILCPAQCNQCNQNLQCIKCADPNYYFFQGQCTQQQPPQTYCQRNDQLSINLFCQICHPACKSCTGPLQSQCSSCNDGFVLDGNSTCICQSQGQAFNPQTQTCSQCQISGCASCKYDINKCDQCQQNLILDQITSECYCQNQSMFFDKSNQQTCLKNTIQHCIQSARYSNLCIQCEAGYLNVSQQLCSYCGKGLYTNQNNQCVNKCQSDCFICTSNSSCVLTKDQTENNNNNLEIDYTSFKCHFSCSICNGNTQTNCLKCSSQTRTYSLTSSSCACKSGYFETGVADCQKYQDLEQSYLSIENSLFIIFLILQMPFIIFNKNFLIIQNFTAVQMIAVLSFDSQLQTNLNFVQLLKLFQKLSFINLANFNFIQNEDYEIQLELNSLIVLTAFQLISLLLLILSFITKNNKFRYITLQIFQTINNLTSTISIAIISNIFTNLNQLLQSQMIILMISSSVQLLFILINTKHLLEKSNILKKNNSSALNDLESCLNKSNSLNFQENDSSILPGNSDNQTSDCKDKSGIYKILLIFQIKRIIIAIILSFLKRSQISLFTSGGLELLYLVLILIIQPFKTRLQNITCAIVQFSVFSCFLIQSFLKNNITTNVNIAQFNQTMSINDKLNTQQQLKPKKSLFEEKILGKQITSGAYFQLKESVAQLQFDFIQDCAYNNISTQKYIKSNYSQSDIIEFARYSTKNYCSQTDETAFQSNSFSQSFNTVPQIFIGILFFDLGTVNYRNAFNFTVKSVDQNQVSIQINKYGDTCIFGIKIQYFATVDQDMQIQNYILQFNQYTDIQNQNSKQYQFKILQKQGQQRGVQCAITGFDSTYQIPPSNDTTYSHRNFQLTTQVDSTNNFYFIQMQAPDLAVNLKIIYVNCIEYYIGQVGGYSMINNIQLQQSTQQITKSQNFQINLDSSFIGNSISSFLGLQQFDLTQSSALRIEYQNFNFQNNQFTFQVITWASSILYSSSILFFQHQMIDCQSSYGLINSNNLKQCVPSCPDGQYPASFQSTLVCSPCSSICKTCSSLNICTSCQSNQFLDPSSQSCSNCDPNCLTCSNSSQQCLSCPIGRFLYNNKCYQSQPQGTYCDQSLTCYDCLKSYQCNYCDNTLQVCLNCINQNLYFFNGVCSILQPPNTYCNLQKICQKCSDSCNGCDLNLNCIQCANPQNFFYFGKCLEQQPPNTYCIAQNGINKYCQSCHPACSQCFGSQLNQCLACQQGYQLVNSSCLCQQGYGYSTVSQQCEACKVGGCIQCSMSLDQCEICQSEFLLDQTTGKCYCSNLQQYYSTEFQTCFQNNIKFCKVSSKYQNACDQCLDGYYNYNQLLCSYCGKSKYTDSNNQCVNDCQPSCIICSNKSTCLLYQSDINSNANGNLPSNQQNPSNQNICDYSCGLCNGSGKSNCLTCSSNTRDYDIQQQTCFCKSGSFDEGDADCQKSFDFEQNYLWILQTIFVIFMVTQSTLVFSSMFTKANLNFYLIQQLVFISFDKTLNMQLNYAKIMKQFQYLSLVTFIPISLVNESNSQITTTCNQIVMLSIFQALALSTFLIQFYLKHEKLKYFDKEILFSCNRLTSTMNIPLILQVIIKQINNISTSTLILLIIASSFLNYNVVKQFIVYVFDLQIPIHFVLDKRIVFYFKFNL
ncbi:hypothetical protein ABPG73_018334 [Tetrahymena malaccensis]